MKDQVLRDDRGVKLGTIEAMSDGTLVGRDARYTKVGEYDPKRNETRDKNGRLVGEGNLLAALIMSPGT